MIALVARGVLQPALGAAARGVLRLAGFKCDPHRYRIGDPMVGHVTIWHVHFPRWARGSVVDVAEFAARLLVDEPTFVLRDRYAETDRAHVGVHGPARSIVLRYRP